jgi:hypothetical protein
MIGLGVGIDYALFIVTRHFRGMKDGLDVRESIVTVPPANDTARWCRSRWPGSRW